MTDSNIDITYRINSCKLLIMEDEYSDVLVKLLYEQKNMRCFCFTGGVMENLLLQFHLSQDEITEIRKHTKAYSFFKMHVNLAFDSGDVEMQKKVCQFATKIAGVDTKQSDKGKKGNKKAKKSKGAETREQALQMLTVFNKRTFKDCIEFDLSKFLALINDMLRTRYAYVFNSDKTPE